MILNNQIQAEPNAGTVQEPKYALKPSDWNDTSHGPLAIIQFAFAGALVLGGSFWGDTAWGRNLLAGLGLIVVGCILGLAGIENVCRRSRFWRAVPRRKSLWMWLVVLLLAHCGISLYKLRTIPGDVIDTFTLQRDATQSLLAGTDPYGTTHKNIYSPARSRIYYGPGDVVNNRVLLGLPYPPVTLLSSVPGYLLGDVRLGFVMSVMASAGFVFAAFPDVSGLLLAALLLLNPATFVIEEHCWTEPLVWMFLCASIYAAIRRPRLLPVALGLFLASKQYCILALPFIGFLLPKFGWRQYAKLSILSLLVAAATIFPFAIWNFPALWHDLVIFHLAHPVRPDAISLAIVAPVLLKAGPVFMLGFILICARKAKPNPAVFAAGYGMAVLLLFCFGKQAFINYYFLVCWSFLLAALIVYQTAPSRRLGSDSEAARAT